MGEIPFSPVHSALKLKLYQLKTERGEWKNILVGCLWDTFGQ
jgi:hypothetical protein